jgi:hypothetical protein
MKTFRYQALVEDSYHTVKEKFGLLANIGSFDLWMQVQLAMELSVNIDRYSTGYSDWQATWDIGHSAKPNVDIWPKENNDHFLFMLKTLWNNNTFLPTINKKVAKDIDNLNKLKPFCGYIVVFPVFYWGSPDRADEKYGNAYAKKRLIQPDETPDQLIDRLCTELDTACNTKGVRMNEPQNARWYSDNWCGTMRWALINIKDK